MEEYRGKAGLSSNVPLRKRMTKGCSVKVACAAGVIIKEMADQATLIAPYPIPCL